MNKTYLYILVLVSLILTACEHQASIPKTETKENTTTFCNPMDISYRFMVEPPSRREAADPTIIRFHDKYILFASKSSGYWWSDDLSKWFFIENHEIPTEDYAPTAIVMRDSVFFMASKRGTPNKVLKSADPLSGKWEIACQGIDQDVWDPAFFQDEDDKLYLYWGCSNKTPIYGVEIDPFTFRFKGKPVALFNQKHTRLGWENIGDYNETTNLSPYIEGAWLNKIDGKYYLQYAAPGTQYKSYCDGLYVSDHPLGTYKLASHNPFSYKPGGFISGAGHSSTFQDNYGNYWHVATMSISVKHKFERRLGLFPAFVDKAGVFYTDTRFGDYPYQIPNHKIQSAQEISTNWMVLSEGKAITASSTDPTHPTNYASDEDVRTYWAAQTGTPGEWIKMNLGQPMEVSALQLNFAEHQTQILGRKEDLTHQYKVEGSLDNKQWELIADRSNNQTDNTHVYFELKVATPYQYIRVTNLAVPDGCFAMSDLRLFGSSPQDQPASVKEFTAQRDKTDKRKVDLTWQEVDDARGYMINFGENENQLYSHYRIKKRNHLSIRSLDAESSYCFTIEAYNESGISDPSPIIKITNK